MISIAEARKFTLSSRVTLASARVPVRCALDRALAETIRAPQPVSPFDNCAMDWYAVRAIDMLRAPSRLRVLGQ
jgi:molybdopterin molybdotransferase